MFLKTFSAVFVFFDNFFFFDFFNYYFFYICCRKFNAEFNTLVRQKVTVLVFWENMMLNTPTFANKFDFIWIFSYSHLTSP